MLIRTALTASFLLQFGCSLADPALLDQLGPEDAGNSDVTITEDASVDGGGDVGPADAGRPNAAVDRCDDPDIMVIDETTENLYINTFVLEPDVNVTARCEVASRGSDGFIAIDVQALDTWHFHLQVRDREDRNPSLYLLPSNGSGGCTDTACEQLSDSCTGSGEEHFSFVPTADGRWYIAIDDGELGGAEYSLSAYRTFCDGTLEHGEACDGGANCTSDCRVRLDEENTNILTTQQNFVEAAEVVVPASGSVTVTGRIGDSQGLCDYPDVFTLRIPSGGADLSVRPSECDSRADARYDFALRSAGGNTLATGDRNAEGCPFITRNGAQRLPEGQYFIEMDYDPLEPNDVSNYSVLFGVTP